VVAAAQRTTLRGDREPAEHVVVELGQPLGRDLGAGVHDERHAAPVELGAQVADRGGDRRGSYRVLVVDVRRRDDRAGPGCKRGLRERDRSLDVGRAVVDAGEMCVWRSITRRRKARARLLECPACR
jgi:hypothetical protein